MSNFTFLQPEWPEACEAATRAEALVYPDPRSACFYARRALELAVRWMYKHDAALRLPYQDHLSALLHEPTFRDAIGAGVFSRPLLVGPHLRRRGKAAGHAHLRCRPVAANRAHAATDTHATRGAGDATPPCRRRG